MAKEGDDLLDPYEILRDLAGNDSDSTVKPAIPFPTHLSPTSLEQFTKCPQAFFFRYILKLEPDPPMTPELARGIICHTALEEVFDLSPENRSLDNLLNLFRREWGRLRGDRDGTWGDGNANGVDESQTNVAGKSQEEKYDILFREEGDGADIEAEVEWGKSCLDLLQNYYELEDPKSVKSPNPLMKEMWVNARFPSNGDVDEFVVRGKIDRIDVLPTRSSDKVQLMIIDYKTGKKPNFKYSESVNKRIAQEQFWKMKVYALVLWRMILQTDAQSEQSRIAGDTQGEKEKQNDEYKYGLSWVTRHRLMQALPSHPQHDPKWSSVLELNSLRLMYLTSHLDDASANGSSSSANGSRSIGKAKYLDFSLGSTPSEFQSILDQTEREIETIARDLKSLVDSQSPHAFEHCDWRYCSCHAMRRRFRRGSVFQSPDDMDYW